MADYRGIDDPDKEKDGQVKICYERWLKLARMMEVALRGFEGLNYHIDRNTEFQEAIIAVQNTIAHWVAPLPARSPSMRIDDVSEQEANDLQALMKAQTFHGS